MMEVRQVDHTQCHACWIHLKGIPARSVPPGFPPVSWQTLQTSLSQSEPIAKCPAYFSHFLRAHAVDASPARAASLICFKCRNEHGWATVARWAILVIHTCCTARWAIKQSAIWIGLTGLRFTRLEDARVLEQLASKHPACDEHGMPTSILHSSAVASETEASRLLSMLAKKTLVFGPCAFACSYRRLRLRVPLQLAPGACRCQAHISAPRRAREPPLGLCHIRDPGRVRGPA